MTVLDFAAEAQAIDDARTAAFTALNHANTRGLTSADVDAIEHALAELAARCEILRRAFYPQWHRLVVTMGGAMVLSESGRVSEIVWKRPRDRW
ncbi:hypothetical protein [Nocardia nova]